MKAIKLYQDPGHGWIAVPVQALALVGLTKNDFTPYSHQSRTSSMLYLEGDCDATTFVHRASSRRLILQAVTKIWR